MGNLTNFGEILAMLYLVGTNSDQQVLNTTLFAGTSPADSSIGAWVGLSNLDPELENSPERGFVEVTNQTFSTAYRRQLAIFAQPAYGSVNTDFRVEATNTNTITFSAIQGNIGTFSYITINYTSDLNNTEIFYFQLPQPITISQGESYTIPIGALKCIFQQHTDYNSSFTLTSRRVALDQILSIQDADAAIRRTALGFRAYEFGSTLTLQAVLVNNQTLPTVGNETPADNYSNLQILTAQRISFDFQEILARISQYDGVSRIGNRGALTFALPADASSTDSLNATHISLVYNLVSPGTTGGPVIASMPLNQSVTLSNSSIVTFQVQTIGLSFT